MAPTPSQRLRFALLGKTDIYLSISFTNDSFPIPDQPSSARLNRLECPPARFPDSNDLVPKFGKESAILSIESRHTPHLPHSIYQSIFCLNSMYIPLPINSKHLLTSSR